MNVQTTKGEAPVNLECECIPPLDLPETWGVPWDRQVSAMEAWQIAWAEIDERSVTISASIHRFVDRRKRVVSIDFPDRRRAA